MLSRYKLAWSAQETMSILAYRRVALYESSHSTIGLKAVRGSPADRCVRY